MLEATFRPVLEQYIIGPCVSCFAKFSFVKPNHMTGLGCLIGVLVMPAIYLDYRWSALLCLWLSGFFDVLDGALARKNHQTSLRGTVYDIVSDRIVEVSVILGLYLLAIHERATVSLLMLASILICVTSFLVVGIVSDMVSNKTFYYSPGLMERAEAFLFFTLMILFPSQFIWLGILFSVLVLFTAIQRVFEFRSLDIR